MAAVCDPPSPGTVPATCRGDARFAAALALAYALLVAVGLAHHELWMDEAQAWLIARDSPTPADVLTHVRYENNPGLWHLLLWPLARLWPDPAAMQVLHGGLATAGVYLVARFAPFGRREKVLFPLGYFVVYEYAVISRSYVLAALGVVVFCALYPRRTQPGPLAGMLAALLVVAWTGVYGWIIAGTLAGFWVAERWGERRAQPQAWRAVWGVACVYLLGAGLAWWRMAPAPDCSFSTEWRWVFEPLYVQMSGGAIAASHLPLLDPAAARPWNSSLIGRLLDPFVAPYGLGLAIWALTAFLLARRPLLLGAYGLGSAALLLFTYVRFFGALRHQGHFVLLAFACWWLMRHEAQARPDAAPPPAWVLAAPWAVALVWLALPWAGPGITFGALVLLILVGRDRLYNLLVRMGAILARWAWARQRALVGLVLLVQAIGGISAYMLELSRPFSASAAVARVIREHGWQDRVLVVDNLYFANALGPPLSALLGRPLTYVGVASTQSGSYLKWDQSRVRMLGVPGAMDRLAAAVARAGHGFAVVSERPLLGKRAGLASRLVAHCDSGLISDEREGFYVYWMAPAGAVAGIKPAAP